MALCSRRSALAAALLVLLAAAAPASALWGGKKKDEPKKVEAEKAVVTEDIKKPEKGWGGMPADADTGRAMPFEQAKPASEFDPETSPWVEQIANKPKAFVFHNFLSKEERAHIIRMAAPLMRRSRVSGNKGQGVVDDIRTSYGMFIKRKADPIIEQVERRISLFTHVPVEHQESMQVLRYVKGQTYRAHMDSGADANAPGPQFRLATFLMYLSEVEDGGETAFPNNSEWADPEIPKKLEAAGVTFSDCAKGHVAYKPRAGDAVLFYSFFPNGTIDDHAMHAGCPVIKGIKWAAPKWIHIDGFQMDDWKKAVAEYDGKIHYPVEPGMCQDEHERCDEWAAGGECERNPTYMIGEGDGQIGKCRKACKVCDACNVGDVECINANRKKMGFLEIDKAEMDWLGVPWWMGEAKQPSPEL